MTTQWTKQAAIARLSQNTLVQEAMRIEPRLRDVIDEATGQENVQGYHRINTWYRLKRQFTPLVGFTATNKLLATTTYWDAVTRAINDLLPPDNIDLGSDDDADADEAVE